MTPATFFPNLRIARDLKISLTKEKVVGGYSCSFKYGVHFDGRLLGNISQDLPSTGIDTTIGIDDCCLLVDALKEKGASMADVEKYPYLPVTAIASCMLGDILREEESLKKMKRRAKTKTLWVCRDSAPTEYFTFNAPFSEDIKQAILVANPAQTIAYFINDDIADL